MAPPTYMALDAFNCRLVYLQVLVGQVAPGALGALEGQVTRGVLLVPSHCSPGFPVFLGYQGGRVALGGQGGPEVLVHQGILFYLGKR